MNRFLLIIALLLTFSSTSGTVTDTNYAPPTRYGWMFPTFGLVAGEYTSICQDHDGFIWIGTDRGLLRFDGNSYDLYTSDSLSRGSLSDNRILSLLCDSGGRLWVATASGLNLYEPDTDSFSLIKLPNLSFHGYIISLGQQADGTVTFIVSGVGLYVISDEGGETTAVRYLPTMVAEKEINTMVCTPEGGLCVGTNGGMVYLIGKNGGISKINVSFNYIKDLALESDGNIIVSDLNRLYRIVRTDNRVEEIMPAENIHVNKLSDGNSGPVYIATAGEGLWRIETGAVDARECADIYCAFMDLSKAYIGTVYCSPDGNIWLGCNYHGVIMIPERNFPFCYRNISDAYSDFGGGIEAMAEWRGNVVVGFDRGRVSMLSPAGEVIMHSRIPGGGTISSFLRDGPDSMLVGMANDGVWELSLPDGGVRKVVDIPGKYPEISMALGNDGDIFVSVQGLGVMRYDRHTGEKRWMKDYLVGRGFTNPYVASMCRTSDDKIWFGHYGGLECYDLRGDSLVQIDQEPFLMGASYKVVQDVNGDVIVATSHGLYEIDGKSGVIRRFTREDGLIDDDIRSVAIDRNGGRWIGSLRGLSYQNPETGKIITYHGGYGLVEKAFDHIVYSPEINIIYLGSNLGITSFCPDSVNTIGFDADVRLSAIYLNGRKLTRERGDRGVAVTGGTSGMPSLIRLPYKDNALTLRLTTMDFRDGSNVKYVWRLLGLGNEWISTRPGENLIYLPHLDPGSYTLEIKAMENNLTSETSVMKIQISSPWYMSVLAKILYFLVLAVIVLLVWLVFKKKREEKENEAKIKYFMDISHDIRSPITLILSPLESLLRQPFDNDVRIKLKTIHRNANRILSLVNQLLDIRKLEKGKMRLRCRETDLNAFVGELVDMFKPQADEKGVELRFEGDVDMPKVWIDRNVVDKILVNLISNAIKFTSRDGNIVVRLSDNEKGESGFVRISVIDTGIGLDSKTSGRIFDRFYQAYDNDGNTKGGFGIGLDLCRRLIEFHHGDISGANRKDGIKGSVFSFTLPVGTECYTDDELRSRIPESGKMREDVPDVVRQPEFTDEPQDLKRRKESSKKRSILVVDDDKELMEYMCGHLGQRYKVMGAGDGKEALRIVADNQPDIIVSDIVMPVMDGITLLRRLKGNADTHHIPVVLLSSKNEVSDRMTGWDKGADAYIGKPFDVEEIEALIDNLIDNRLRIKGKFSGVQETDGKISAPEVKSADDALMERIMKIIDKSIDDPKLNVEMLSAEVGISRAHLHRKMKDMIGMTPSDFIRTIRIRRACELLQKGSVEVTQVAYALGFSSQSHFSTTFKNFTGMTPSEYRARCIAGDVPGLSVTKDDINQDSK